MNTPNPADGYAVTLAEVDECVLDAVLAIGVRLDKDGASPDKLRAGMRFALARVGVVFPDDSVLSGLLMAALERMVSSGVYNQ